MMTPWQKMLLEVRDEIENMEAHATEFDNSAYIINDLKTKVLMNEVLASIDHNLFEISHYGIGTD